METVASYFGSMVFNDEAMRERLPKDVILCEDGYIEKII